VTEAAARPGPSLMACPHCGALHRVRRVPHGAVATCRTCGGPLYRRKRGSIGASLAINLAALILFTIAHIYPFMTFELEGQERTATLLTGPQMLWQQGMWPLAVLVVTVASVIPGLRLAGLIAVLTPLYTGRLPRFGARIFRAVELLHPWAMMEVYLLGVIVAYVKLSDMATLELGLALFSFVGLVLLMITAEGALEPQAVWERLKPQFALQGWRPLERPIACAGCGQLVSEADAAEHDGRCPRCAARLRRRKPDSLARTWALLITAAILYVPANLLPIMTVTYFGSGVPDTILSGVVSLAAAGMLPVAALVFFASIVVPVVKIVGLAWLLVSVQTGQLKAPRRRTLAYRAIEGVGRWSMVDIFMISILVALVDLGGIATVEPALGALCFAAVVVLTMLAAETFDPRLIWDVREAHGERDAIARA
jgi:paraquat-inducible protein A